VRPATVPRRVLFFATLIAAGALAGPAFAQDISINLGQGNGGVTERAIQLIALLTVLSIAPSILVMMTSFTRIVVVLSLLRTALGTATAPPNSVIIALAMFLTAFVMGPVLQKSYDDGIKPLVANQIGVEDALQRASVPLRGFMLRNVREKDLKLFMDLSGEAPPATPEEMSLRILVPAFMISELKRAFEIGFLLFLPFLIIDLVVASVLMSMGMIAAVQADFLRAGRWLVAGGGQPRAKLRGLAGHHHCPCERYLANARPVTKRKTGFARNDETRRPQH
jgi:flagellar biosynthetic protein FliP